MGAPRPRRAAHRATPTSASLDVYDANGRIHTAATADGLHGSEWSATGSLRPPCRVSTCSCWRPAARRSEQLNRGSPVSNLQAFGQLGPDELQIGGRGFAVPDDRVVALRNDYRLFDLLNGTTRDDVPVSTPADA